MPVSIPPSLRSRLPLIAGASLLVLLLIAGACFRRTGDDAELEKVRAELAACGNERFSCRTELENYIKEYGEYERVPLQDGPPLPEPPRQEQTSDLELVKQELLKKIPKDVRADVEKDLTRLQGTLERGLERRFDAQNRQLQKRFDEMASRQTEAGDLTAKLEEKEQELQEALVARSTLEVRDTSRIEKIRELAGSLSRFEQKNLDCGSPSNVGDGLGGKKKKEICFFLQEHRKGLEGLTGG